MRKTSVYVSDELKTALADAAARSGTSEAEFIRAAIEAACSERVVPDQVRCRPLD